MVGWVWGGVGIYLSWWLEWSSVTLYDKPSSFLFSVYINRSMSEFFQIDLTPTEKASFLAKIEQFTEKSDHLYNQWTGVVDRNGYPRMKFTYFMKNCMKFI